MLAILLNLIESDEERSRFELLYVEKKGDGFELKRVVDAYEPDGTRSDDFPPEFLAYVESKSDDLTLDDFYEADRKKAEKQLLGN